MRVDKERLGERYGSGIFGSACFGFTRKENFVF